jgi:hypothetical protein
MIDPTNPRVIQDSMRAMAGYSQGLIPTLMRTIARMVGTVTNPRAQTPVFDRILSQIQPQVIRGLSQQSAVAAQNFVPPTTIEYVSPNLLGPDNNPMRLSQRDVDDGLASGIWTPDFIRQNFQQQQVADDTPAPERLSVSQVDHVIRTMLRGAEAMGISAERLAGIDWAGIDLDTILTGAVENGEFNLDLSQIPGLDQDITDAFRSVAEGIATSGIQPLIQNAPLNRGQRTQAISEPQRRADDIQLNTTLQRLSAWLQRFSPQANMQGQRDPRTTLLQGLSGFLGQGAGATPGGFQSGMQPHHTGQIAGPQNNPQVQSSIANALQRAVQGAGNVAVRAGNFAFNRLPQFIQRPILGAATQAGGGAAAAAGMNAAGQAAAGAAAANAARVAVGLKVLSVGIGLVVGAVVGVVAGLKSLANAAWATTQRVMQYNGALAAASAMSEARTIMRDVRIGNIIGEGGADRIEAQDNLADALAPLEASMALIGNKVATEVITLLTAGVRISNQVASVVLPMLADLVYWMAGMGMVGQRAAERFDQGVDRIVNQLRQNGQGGGMHPLGGDTVLTEMFNMALRNDMPLQMPPQNGNVPPMIPPAGGP